MKHEKKDLSLVSPLDWARLAMCIDCEGHIQIGHSVHRNRRATTSRTRYEYINIVVSNTDTRLMEWVMRFGGRIYVQRKKQPDKWKPSFRWNIACTQAADILKGCLPYFVIKRDQAELALTLQATMRRVGIGGTPQYVIEERAVIRQKLKALTSRGPQPITKAS